MEKQIIATKEAPSAIGPYSQGVQVGNMVYFSGQIAIVPETGKLAEGGTKAQAEQVMRNIGALLKAVGAKPSNIVKTTVFIVDITEFAEVNAVYGAFFDGSFPARSCVAVKELPMGARVEVEVTVAL